MTLNSTFSMPAQDDHGDTNPREHDDSDGNASEDSAWLDAPLKRADRREIATGFNIKATRNIIAQSKLQFESARKILDAAKQNLLEDADEGPNEVSRSHAVSNDDMRSGEIHEQHDSYEQHGSASREGNKRRAGSRDQLGPRKRVSQESVGSPTDPGTRFRAPSFSVASRPSTIASENRRSSPIEDWVAGTAVEEQTEVLESEQSASNPFKTVTSGLQGLDLQSKSGSSLASSVQGRGRPPKAKANAQPNFRPEYLVRNADNNSWVTPTELDLPTRIAMEANVSAITNMRRSQLRIQRAIHKHDITDYYCFGCQVIEKNTTICDPQDEGSLLTACIKCRSSGKHPCGKLIYHPYATGGCAIGFVPMPEDERDGADWKDKKYWVASGPNRPKFTPKKAPVEIREQPSRTSLRRRGQEPATDLTA